MKKWVIDKRLLKQADFSILIIALIISVFGALNVYSASRASYGTHYLIAQFVGIGMSLIVVYVILLLDYSFMSNYATVFYWIGNMLLFYTAFHSEAVKGANSWMKVGGQSFAPVGFFQVILTIFIARKISDMDGEVNNLKNFSILMLYTLIPVLLVYKQPNLGEAIICLCIALGIIFISGIDLKIIYASVAIVVPFVLILWNSSLLKAYQKARITSLFNPTGNEQGSGYQLANSLVAIGSGGLFGKGFLKGTQVSGGYIPEDHTDFIFAVVGEEWGIIGAVALLILYALLLYKILKIGIQSKDLLGRLICIGTFSSLTFSIFQNIAMTIGLAPIAGIPLPFMSHGNSFIFSNFMAIALVMNVGMRKKKINF
ncbi:rod shape determining protein RodA [Clostridium acidisoli DSM 12555]|uniref:Rod shape determining protein RodA n=1 Tax=Clostridium acidisoli DSM 12555 TaxID=1121291 RepID=A0A1W1XLQ6_9CLOT|nr:rod shape-determining protein RodA [Clostridium acidisoli]SMC24774.1 rod shape determining protein RodA [Clostridium acidisoli DSM 12555]